MQGNSTLPPEIRQAAETALSARFGGRVKLDGEVHNFWPSRVFRSTLLRPSPGSAPSSVIVRIPREAAPRSERAALDRERIALEYLSVIGSALAPCYLAGGSEAGFLVTGDLETGPSLLDLLLGQDPAAAREGSLAFARSLGALHAQTIRRPEGPWTDLPVVRVPVAEHWQQVREAAAHLDLPMLGGADNDVQALVRFLEEQGDCLALSSGDPSVVNCKISTEGAQFFDFESACYRCALMDAAVLRYPYPTGGPAWRLPNEVTMLMERAYRAELAKVCPIAQEDDLWERGMASSCAAWTIIRLARLPKVDTGPDRDPWLLLPSGWSGPVPTRSRRRQLVAILETYLASAHHARAFAALTHWCESLAAALRACWPEASEDLPLYPAFL